MIYSFDGMTPKIAESAFLAAIPNNPGVYNPYNIDGHDGLIERQHKTLDVMVEMGYITQEEADAAMRMLRRTGDFKEVSIVREIINLPLE